MEADLRGYADVVGRPNTVEARAVDVVQQAAVRLGVTCDAVHVKDQYAAEGIVEEAKARNCDLIVMASHNPVLKDYLLGPNSARVVRHADCSVLVVRD